MSDTYRAVLKDDHLEWIDKKPEGDNPLNVTVVVHHEQGASQGKKMAYYLGKLADLNAVGQIEDPVAWQREIRSDRILPDRDV